MHAPANSLVDLEQELARQTLVSERWRCTILAGVLSVILGVMVVYWVALSQTPGALPGIGGVMIVVVSGRCSNWEAAGSSPGFSNSAGLALPLLPTSARSSKWRCRPALFSSSPAQTLRTRR